MSAAVRQRGRIARVRRVQHLQAAGVAADAAAQAASLEGSAQRLTALRGVLMDNQGHSHGKGLAAAHELAGRLETAQTGLADAIRAAHEAVALRDRERIEARINQEGAERLQLRAMADAVAQAERRTAAMAWARRQKESMA